MGQASLEWCFLNSSFAEQRGNPPHRAGGTRARHLEQSLPANQQRAAEGFNTDRLVDGHRFPGQKPFIHHQTVAIQERAIRGNPLTRLHTHDVAGHKFATRTTLEVPIAQHPGHRLCQGTQLRQRLVGPELLQRSKTCIEQQHRSDSDGFKRPLSKAVVAPSHEVEHQGHEQQINERTTELADESQRERYRWRLRQGVGAVLNKALRGVRPIEPYLTPDS